MQALALIPTAIVQNTAIPNAMISTYSMPQLSLAWSRGPPQSLSRVQLPRKERVVIPKRNGECRHVDPADALRIQEGQRADRQRAVTPWVESGSTSSSK